MSALGCPHCQPLRRLFSWRKLNVKVHLKDLGVDGKIILKYVKGKLGKFALVLAGSEQGQELCCREDGYEILILITRGKSLDYLKMC